MLTWKCVSHSPSQLTVAGEKPFTYSHCRDCLITTFQLISVRCFGKSGGSNDLTDEDGYTDIVGTETLLAYDIYGWVYIWGRETLGFVSLPLSLPVTIFNPCYRDQILSFIGGFSSCSDGEDTEALDWLPGAPEIEDAEEPGWGQLEVCW